jgi:hypothetical protein
MRYYFAKPSMLPLAPSSLATGHNPQASPSAVLPVPDPEAYILDDLACGRE